MKEIVSRGLGAAADLLLPRGCLVCGRKLLLDEKHICLECLADMPRTFFWRQKRNAMADKFNEVIGKDQEDLQYEAYAYASALFFYHSEADYRLIPHQIKYHGNISAGKHFGRMLGRYLTSSDLYSDVDLVIPVPLHWSRKWKRGYNQAEVIAAAVAEQLEAPLDTSILKRPHRTATQTRMSIEEKSRNVFGAFAAAADGIRIDEFRHILLVDDVFTTGSTSGACFHALRQVFPPSVRISIATLGFVGH